MVQWQSSVPRRAQLLLAVVFSLVFAGLTGWLVAIQVRSGDKLSRRAERQHTVRRRIEPFRGAIVDRFGRPLAMTIDAYLAFADPRIIHQEQRRRNAADVSATAGLPQGDVDHRSTAAALAGLATAERIDDSYARNRARVARRVGPLLGMNVAKIEALIAADPHKRFVRLKRGLDRPTREAVEALGERGIGFQAEGRRQYPAGTLAAHLVGGVGADNQGLAGLEYRFDEVLRGSAGSRTVVVDGRRRAVWIRPDDYRPARDGQLLVTTIDLTIQSFAERALARAVDKFKARGGSALVMDPASGEILALANYPTFDPARYNEAAPYALRNRLLTDPYEPGSTFKCFVATAALQAGVVRPNEKIFCHNGSVVIRGRHLRDHRPFGTLTFQEIVIRSSNIGMAIIGERMGNQRLHEAVRRFGFGRRTGLSLPGESPGLVYPLDKWSKWSATSIPMGYEILVTPLQIATAFSAIANGGLLMKPRVVRYTCGPDRKVVRDMSAPIVVRRIMTEETSRFMRRQVLREVVRNPHGTGRRVRIPGYGVFGKTGTAKKRDPHGPGYSDRLYVGSFIGGVPLENPRIVAMVLIDEPRKSIGYYGGTVAGPAVREILARSLGYLNVPPDDQRRIASSRGQSSH
ncbi:MAG: hypothetical protein GWP05_08425 [Anaerolineaceae bacterium]|nr:hypothetical protein [Anaerolineaceae bacterium]